MGRESDPMTVVASAVPGATQETKEVVKKFNINDSDIIGRINSLRIKSGDNPLQESQVQEFLSIREDLKIGDSEFYMGGNVDKFFVGQNGDIVLGSKSSEKAVRIAEEMGMYKK